MGCYQSHINDKKIELPDDTMGKWTPSIGTTKYQLRYKSYLYSFQAKQISLIHQSSIEFSNFALHGLKIGYNKILSTYKKQKDIYVVCPVYCNANTGALLDTQLAITGTCYKDEPDDLATVREIAEEVGVIINKNMLEKIHDNITQKRTEATYIIDISKSRAFDPKIDHFEMGQDDKSRKVQIILVGKFDDLVRLYSSVYNRPISDDYETIKHVRFLSLKEFI